MPKKKAPSATMQYEKDLQELQELVERMEQGEQGLEQSLQDFERGIQLVRACQGALNEAEQKVQVLVQQNGNEQLQNFHSEDGE